ncbi:Sodium/calcium exchanger protein-domain-containing protein [Lineolata rhizophorae]|uniref:Sodium/calcium exchanger protein-domain-containing protein n=1 Tax=Lineolata rhizophorae TaxID=578093 RepID=A0A6A6NSU4_9PEZI|nr:Sodium/calcium exchanger protein-domain-containing protein [Lineolata rhizophorae]
MADHVVARTRHRAAKRQRQKYSARPFYLTILVISIIAVLAILRDRSSGVAGSDLSSSGLLRRDVGLLQDGEDEECRHVHKAVDKCAFVHANCPDEEAGIISYLSLYYCRLPHAKALAFVILILWLALLFSTIGIAASDFFSVNLSTIASLLGMSESLAGVTFLAFGNGSPDVFSTFAAMSTNSGSLAVGELIGAASFITAVVAGSMALVRPFQVARRSFIRDVCFFTAAAGFSLVFLWDGALYLWECVAMVGFYLFYVVFVVVWHWWLTRRRRWRQIDVTSRSHFVVPGGEEADMPEYHDEDEDGSAGTHTRTQSRGVSQDDFAALEMGGDGAEEDELEEEEARGRWMSELSNNMRLSRPRSRARRLTKTPIRPSLVGALEFRAVLTSLQKSRNIQSQPIYLRRYSDDPNFTTAQQQDRLSTFSDPASSRPSFDVSLGPDSTSLSVSRPSLDARDGPHRVRAVSANGADALRIDHDAMRRPNVPQIDLLAPLAEDRSITHDQSSTRRSSLVPPSPTISLSPPPSQTSRASSPAPSSARALSPNRLAPPSDPNHPNPQHRDHHGRIDGQADSREAVASTATRSGAPKAPKLQIPSSAARAPQQSGHSPVSPFPAYTDYPLSASTASRAPSIRLPSPSMSPESYYGDTLLGHDEPRPPKWWPLTMLPPPQVLFSTLFPTLYTWKDKNTWERFLAIVAAPSIFLLTITLPVVETQKDEEDEEDGDDGTTAVPELSLPGPASPVPPSQPQKRPPQNAATVRILIDDDGQPTESSTLMNGHGDNHAAPHAAIEHNLSPSRGRRRSVDYGTIDVATAAEDVHRQRFHSGGPGVTTHGPPQQAPQRQRPRPQPQISASPEQLPAAGTPKAVEPKQWNRWLVMLQTFTAPLFIVVIVWANMHPTEPYLLVKPVLVALVVSLVVLALLIGTTTATRPPRWRPLLCFVGFAVSITWISTIANEVVGVLKTLGVVLNISDAILGLTIFAVGNSLGDFVADITVARLGYPIMALSACFGGPMLNILIGIGVSGCYMTIKGAKHKQEKHPDRPMKFKPYHIDVSSTLMISGATLMVTLVGLLIVVPWRKWRMDRQIGWGLVVLWAVSTIANVILEICGVGVDVS